MKITIGNIEARAELLEKEAPTICARMKEVMPIEGMLASAKIVDNEITFMVPFFIDEIENLRLTVPGDIAFYNTLQSVCIFYDDHKPLTPVCVWAKLSENLEGFKEEANKVFVNQGTMIKMELGE
jgi:hypothetical protein